jgi:hypothetical protein
VKAHCNRIVSTGFVLLALIMPAWTGTAHSAATAIDACGTVISSPGIYTIGQSLTSTSATVDCIEIASPGVSLGIAPAISLSGPGGAGVTAAGIKVDDKANGVQIDFLGATIQGFGVGIDDEGSGLIISGAPTGATITGNAAQGILVNKADAVLIDSVVSQNNGGAGLELLHATGVIVTGVPIFQENGGYGLWVHSSSHNQFFNVDAFENKSSGIYVGESGIDKLGAKASDGEPSTDNVFLDGGAIQNGGAGIVLDFGDNRNVVADFTGQSNTDDDAIDGTPACTHNKWVNNMFGKTNRSCIQ